MIDHITFGVADLKRSVDFYRSALAPLGLRPLAEVSAEQSGRDAFVGIGADRPFFWLADTGPVSGQLHVAFAARDRAAVDAFHQAALTAGASDNGGPGLRPHYGPTYYGAFVRDPDGHNIEAVCRTAP